MRFDHLGRPVRDERRSQEFYAAYFGSDPATAQRYEDGTVIIRDADGFDLALHPSERVEPSPTFLHAGFRAATPDEVRALLARLDASPRYLRAIRAARAARIAHVSGDHARAIAWSISSGGSGKGGCPQRRVVQLVVAPDLPRCGAIVALIVRRSRPA
jgi:hypothetical protein